MYVSIINLSVVADPAVTALCVCVCVCVCVHFLRFTSLEQYFGTLRLSRAGRFYCSPSPRPPPLRSRWVAFFSIFLKPKLSFTATKNRTMRHCYPYLFFYVCLYVRLHLQIMPRPLFATADSLLHTHTHTLTHTHPKL